MKRLGRIINTTINGLGHFSGWLVPLMMLLVLYEVFMRYILDQPPMIADEFSGYLLVALAYLGAAFTWKEGGHVRITALINRLPQKTANWLGLITRALTLLFALVLIQSGYSLIAFSFKFNMSSASWMRIPLQGPHLTMVIGFAFLALVIIVDVSKATMNLLSGRRVEETEAYTGAQE